MPRNGSGNYSLPQLPFTAGSTISSAAVNSDLSDIATALTGSVSSDGQTPITGTLQGTPGSAAAPSYAFSNEKTTGFFLNSTGQLGVALLGAVSWIISATGIATPGGMSLAQPVGAVQDYAGSTAPAGWVLCYGQAISRTTYAALFAVIGTTYGSGDGTTTFNVPDCRGRVVPGKDDMGGTAANRITTAGCGVDGKTLGAAGAAQTQILTTPNLPPYTPAGTLTAPTAHVNLAGAGQATSGSSGQTTQASSSPVIFDTPGSFTGTAQGGTSTPFSVVQPIIIFNKIMFAGA